MADPSQSPVVIVGASVAGCAAALEFARKGVRVCLVDKQNGDEGYKKVCTHLIHPPGRAWLEDFGLYERLRSMGGQDTRLQVSCDHYRLHYPLSRRPEMANIERRHLDPVLREAIERHPLIDVRWGHRLQSLLRHPVNGRVTGIRAIDTQGETITLQADLVVAADGRKSRVAKLDLAQETRITNHRVALFSYFESRQAEERSHIWAFDQGSTYIGCIPNGPRTVVSCYIPEERFEAIRGDVDGFFNSEVLGHLQREGIELGEQADDLFVAKDTQTLYRRPRSPGLVFVGDAFLAADPLTGVGCAWAMGSSRLLVKTAARALASKAGPETRRQRLDRALGRYRLWHGLSYLLPAWVMAKVSNQGQWVFNRPVLGFADRLCRLWPRLSARFSPQTAPSPGSLADH